MTKRKHDIWDNAVGCSVAIMLGITVFAFILTYLITWTTVFDFSNITPRWWPRAAKFLGYVVPFRRVGNAEFSCGRGTQNVGVYAGVREETPVLVIGPVPHLPCNVRLLILHYTVRLQRPNGGTICENLLQKPDDSLGMEGILRAQDEGIPCCVISEQTIWITPDELFARVYGIETEQEESPGWCRTAARTFEDGKVVFRWTVTGTGEKQTLKIPGKYCLTGQKDCGGIPSVSPDKEVKCTVQ